MVTTPPPLPTLALGVLSAPERDARRAAARGSWLLDASVAAGRVAVRFVLGKAGPGANCIKLSTAAAAAHADVALVDAAEAPGGKGIGEKGGAFKPQDLSLGFWSAAVLASQPRREPPLRATSAPDEKEKQKETEHTRGQVLFRVVRAYAKHLPSLTPQSVSPEGLSAVFAATLALDAVAPETRAALAPAWRALAGPAEAAWRATKTRDPTVSKLQEDVGRVLRQMGVPLVLACIYP